MQALRGIVFYASQKAKRDRYIKEGLIQTITSYKNVRTIEGQPNVFVEVNLDDSGTNYVHMQLV